MTTEQLAEHLDMTGTEVGGIHHHGVGSPEDFIVGRVLTADKHPDADRLTVCTVAVGRATSRRSSAAPAQRRRRPDRGRRPARRGDARRHEARQGQAAWGAERGHDPTPRTSSASDPARRIMVLDGDGLVPGTRWPTCSRSPPTSSSSRSRPTARTASPSTAWRARSTRPTRADLAPPPWNDDPANRATCPAPRSSSRPCCARASPPAPSRT